MTVVTINNIYVLNIVFLLITGSECNVKNSESEKQLSSIKLPPCQACKMVVDSFLKGMERTARMHFGGGDTAWEEEKLGTYANSEVRLVEVQEHLCEETRARDQCLTLAEEWEQLFEQWWLSDRRASADLLTYICVETVQVCCPPGHFGPSCQPCPGFPDRVCNNNGKCKGNGTRKGNGECSCDEGYAGQFCEQCAAQHYISYQDKDKLLCSRCHQACEGGCSQAGVRGCEACVEGWLMDGEKGCQDVDECFATTAPCNKNQFCVNNEGSYSCLACDPSCDGCSGDGPDMCDQCAHGFSLKDNLCVDSQDTDSHMDMTRYLTYLGLCVATCIIFQNSPALASGVGLAVALYVTVSEYTLGNLESTNNVFSHALQYFKS